jgi:formyl-CoA transferase
MTRRVSNPAIGEFDIVSNCLTLSRAPDEPYLRTPERGEHTDEVLGEFGYSAGEIAKLREAGVI